MCISKGWWSAVSLNNVLRYVRLFYQFLLTLCASVYFFVICWWCVGVPTFVLKCCFFFLIMLSLYLSNRVKLGCVGMLCKPFFLSSSFSCWGLLSSMVMNFWRNWDQAPTPACVDCVLRHWMIRSCYFSADMHKFVCSSWREWFLHVYRRVWWRKITNHTFLAPRPSYLSWVKKSEKRDLFENS